MSLYQTSTPLSGHELASEVIGICLGDGDDDTLFKA